MYFSIKVKHKIKTIVGLQPDHPDRKVSLDKVIKIFKRKKLDFLYSKDKYGNKNGAHYILSKRILEGNKSKKPANSLLFILTQIQNRTYLAF